MPTMEWAWLIPALSFVAFPVIAIFGRYLPGKGSFVAILAIAAGFALFWFVAIDRIIQGATGLDVFVQKWFQAGSATFTLKDEHYMMEMNDPDVDLFLYTESKHGRQPAGWTRSQGKGRVGVLTPGHNPEVWRHPSFQALLRNCIGWCNPNDNPGERR